MGLYLRSSLNLAYASCASYTRVLLILWRSKLEYNWIFLDSKTIHNIFTHISISRLIFFCFFLLELRFLYNNGRFRQLDLLYPLIRLTLPVCISSYVGRLLTWEKPVLWWMISDVLYILVLILYSYKTRYTWQICYSYFFH